MNITLNDIETVANKHNVKYEDIIHFVEYFHFKKYGDEWIFQPNLKDELRTIFEDLQNNTVYNTDIYIERYGDERETRFDEDDEEDYIDQITSSIDEIMPKIFIWYDDKLYLELKDYINIYNSVTNNKFDDDFINEAKKYIDKRTILSTEDMLELCKNISKSNKCVLLYDMLEKSVWKEYDSLKK